MRKTILAITGAAVLGLATVAPANAFVFLFFAPYMAAHTPPNMQATNAPAKAAHKHTAKKMAKH